MKDSSAKNRLDKFLGKFWPEVEELGRAVLEKMRARLPGAVQMVYDNFNWLVVGFSPNDRPSDAIFSVVIAPQSVFVCFLQGAKLPDPDKLLQGSGKIVRNLRLEEAEYLDDPRVRKLIDVALKKRKFRCLAKALASSLSDPSPPNNARAARSNNHWTSRDYQTARRYIFVALQILETNYNWASRHWRRHSAGTSNRFGPIHKEL